MLVNSCTSKVDRTVIEGGKTESSRVPEFSNERDERVKILVNFCISKVDRTVMEGRRTESGREFPSLLVKGLKE